MNRPATAVALTLAVSLLAVLPAYAQAVSRSPQGVVRRDALVELTVPHDPPQANPDLDASLEVVLTSPRGATRRVRGFRDGDRVWRVRFRPDAVGRWTYAVRLTTNDSVHGGSGGTFECVDAASDGLVVRDPRSPHRWMFSSGRPYFPVGLQDCANPVSASVRDKRVDGEGRTDPARRVSWDDYFEIYGKAGFNLFRFSQRNCSFSLSDDLVEYRQSESRAVDELLASARAHGFRIMFGIFGNHLDAAEGGQPAGLVDRLLKVMGWVAPGTWAPSEEVMARERRFIDYAVARWGAYVDFWELLNERAASDAWTAATADYVRAADPDGKPVTTSWEKPGSAAIDLNEPHWYESEDELASDLRVAQLATTWKQPGKPVIVGEQGNRGMNWDPRSALRMRIRTWTALFEEIGFVFWNTNWSKAGMFQGRYTPDGVANIYLGPEERGYIRVLQQYSSRLSAGLHVLPVEVSPGQAARAYGLSSDRTTGVYLHHYESHASPISGVHVTAVLPGASKSLVGEWIEPATGRVIGRVPVSGGRQTLDAPPFTVDLALLVAP